LPKEFTYRGQALKELQRMSMDEFIRLLPARQRRSLQRGLSDDERSLIEKLREARKRQEKGEKAVVETHCRDMIILPEMVGLTIAIHNGKVFHPVQVQPTMLGHYLGEFAITNQKVVHGTPGIGASKSSMYVPLK